MTTEALLCREVSVENGTVFTSVGKNRKVIWVKCSNCGPQAPATAYDARRETYCTVTHLTVSFVYQQPFSCSQCGQDGPWREALIPRERTRPHEKCNRRCLDGKIICHCACEGRCHGEGKCTCKEGSDGDRA